MTPPTPTPEERAKAIVQVDVYDVMIGDVYVGRHSHTETAAHRLAADIQAILATAIRSAVGAERARYAALVAAARRMHGSEIAAALRALDAEERS